MQQKNDVEAGTPRRSLAWAFAASFLFLSPQSQAAEQPRVTARDLLAQHLRLQRDGHEWKALIADGKARADFCARCHGAEGASTNPLVPNLAAQNPYYLLEQIEQFANGKRRDYIMSPLAQQFTAQDRAAVAFFYANMPPARLVADASLVREGEKVFAQRCVSCHGRDAHGSDAFARLAGQHPTYLQRRLAAFREANGKSTSPMAPVAAGLVAKEIEVLGAYLSSLP